MNVQHGAFVISLDFEQYWGACDKVPFDEMRDCLLGVSEAIPAMLALFQEYQIHATWATVGMLFFESREALLQGLPSCRPQYSNITHSAYDEIQRAGNNEVDDPHHYAPSLIRQILTTPHQELACHTFAHYYCLEAGQDVTAFAADIEAAQAVAQKSGMTLSSLVFPRNQFNQDYLDVLAAMGIVAYRGNGQSWLTKATDDKGQTLLRRGMRLMDAFINLSGKNGYALQPTKTLPIDVPASRFLRPYSPRFRFADTLRLRRVTSELDYAARHNLLYHIYWHPQNFGTFLTENLAFLRKVLDHYAGLRDRYGMESLTMLEVAERLRSATPVLA